MKYKYGRFNFENNSVKIYACFMSEQLAREYVELRSDDIVLNTVDFISDGENLKFYSTSKTFEALEDTRVYDDSEGREYKLTNYFVSEEAIKKAIKELEGREK